MRIVFMGTPEFAVPPLEQLVLNRYEVGAVYTQPDRPAGRGRAQMPSPVKRAALGWDLPVVQPGSLKSAEALAQLAGFKPEAIVVAAYGEILPKKVLDLPRYGCVNIHPSLLPRWRGASPVAAAILAGDEITGVTIMLLDAGMDTGPILAQMQVPISPQDTTGTLTARLSQLGAKLLLDVLARLPEGEITPQPQDDTRATYCKPISKEDGEIDWRLSAVEIWRRVRAFNPSPGCYTRWRGKQLKILEATPISGKTAEAGRVLEVDKEAGFGVGTGNGVLGVVKVQIEGKRVMSAADFLRGQRDFMGTVLPN